MSTDIIHLVGGDKIAIVQLGKPVGRNGRSSIEVSEVLVGLGFQGIILWARGTETYHSIIQEFESRRFQRASLPAVAPGWKPEITFMPCRN